MNDSDTKFIVAVEVAEAASTHGTSLTTPVANRQVVPSDNQSKKKKNKQEKLEVDQKSKN